MSPQAASRVGVFFLVASVAAGVAPARAATFTVNTVTVTVPHDQR